MTDETGSIATGKLIWSDRAWTELFFGTTSHPVKESSAGGGRESPNLHCDGGHGVGPDRERQDVSWEELTTLDLATLRNVEEQLLYSRVTLTFGWSPAVDRLCVLGVEW